MDEVVEYLLQDLHVAPNSVQSSTSKAKRKKNKEASSIEEANASQQLHYTLMEAKMSSKKKKKKTMAQGSLANGHDTSDDEDPEGNGHFKDTSEVNILNGKIVGLRRRAGETLNCLST